MKYVPTISSVEVNEIDETVRGSEAVLMTLTAATDVSCLIGIERTSPLPTAFATP